VVVPVGVSPGNAPVEADAHPHPGQAEQLTFVVLGGRVHQQLGCSGQGQLGWEEKWEEK